jgi:hypothetical protein
VRTKIKMSRVEILVVIVMALQGVNYLFTMLGNPVKWGVDFNKRVSTLETKAIEKCKVDSVYYASNLSDHTSMKNDISLIKNAVLTASTGSNRIVKF